MPIIQSPLRRFPHPTGYGDLPASDSHDPLIQCQLGSLGQDLDSIRLRGEWLRGLRPEGRKSNDECDGSGQCSGMPPWQLLYGEVGK